MPVTSCMAAKVRAKHSEMNWPESSHGASTGLYTSTTPHSRHLPVHFSFLRRSDPSHHVPHVTGFGVSPRCYRCGSLLLEKIPPRSLTSNHPAGHHNFPEPFIRRSQPDEGPPTMPLRSGSAGAAGPCCRALSPHTHFQTVDPVPHANMHPNRPYNGSAGRQQAGTVNHNNSPCAAKPVTGAYRLPVAVLRTGQLSGRRGRSSSPPAPS